VTAIVCGLLVATADDTLTVAEYVPSAIDVVVGWTAI
jgi:hypothetical protein